MNKLGISLLLALLLTAAMAASASKFAVWVPPSALIRVMPHDPPAEGSTAELDAARGEYQSFQVAVHAPERTVRVTGFSVSPLVSDVGTKISGDNITCYREWYLTVRQHSRVDDDATNRPITSEDTFPDALIPFVDRPTITAPSKVKYRPLPIEVKAGSNAVFWVDVFVPRTAGAGFYKGSYRVETGAGTFRGNVGLRVRDFTLPLRPSLMSGFNSGGHDVPGLNEELLRNRIMPSCSKPDEERSAIEKYGLEGVDTDFFSGVNWGHYQASRPPSVDVLKKARAAHDSSLFIYDESGDPESGSTDPALVRAMIQWAQALHKAGINNLLSQEPTPEYYDDGLGAGRSAVDIWEVLPQAYDHAQSFDPPRVTQVLKRGCQVWSYNCLLQDPYSPKWMLDFAPINYRIQAGFISQSLGLTGLRYWSVDDWPADPWTNPQSAGYSEYPGEGILVYPGGPAGVKGVVPSMRLKYLRDGVQDYEYIQILKKRGQSDWLKDRLARVATDWKHWTRDPAVLETARKELGARIEEVERAAR